MALANLVVFNQYAYGAFQELLPYNIRLFNAATGGGIVLRDGRNRGNFTDATFWKSKTLTRRRNAQAVTAISQVEMEMAKYSTVKVDGGTPELIYYESDMVRILQNPKEEGIKFGIAMAEQRLADMLNIGLGSYCAAMANVGATVYTDWSGTGTFVPTWGKLMDLKQLRGDKAADIGCWVMNSKNGTDLLKSNLTNAEQLFQYAGVDVRRDPEGRTIVITDHPALVIGSGPPDYYIPGLVPGAIVIEDNGDFNASEAPIHGREQIGTSYQAEWSFQVGIMGFSWDTATGGASPTNAALFSGGNWDRVFTNSVKDLGGVLGRSL